MSDQLNILFLCARNAARSIMAEAALNAMDGKRFRGHSAGSTPRADGLPDPLTLQVLRAAGLPAEGLRSKSWNEFGAQDAPPMDLVITLCDVAAGEICPVWPGNPARAHWTYPDPAQAQGSPEELQEAYRLTLHALRRRLELLVNLPVEKLERVLLQEAAQQLAEQVPA